MPSSDRSTRALGMLVLSLLLVSCGHQRTRDDASRLMREGRFEQALGLLEVAAKNDPDSALLRAGLLQARGEALTRLLAEAGGTRGRGQFEEAESLLQRANAIDPESKRVQAARNDLAIERRTKKAVEEAQLLVEQRQLAQAWRLIADALKDNPRHPELTTLQRRLELDIRQAQVRTAQAGIAESRPISLDFRDANLRTVLDVVTRNSGINFILDKDIRPDARVTVFLRSTRVEDAIDLIVSSNQLAKKVLDPQTILIYPNTQEKRGEHQEQVVRVFYLASAEAKGAATFLRAMLKLREPYVDERANMIAIRDSAEMIELAERLLALYDGNEPEVSLELEVIEIRSNRLTNLGIQFPNSFSLTPISPNATGGLTLGNVGQLGRDNIGLTVGGLLVNLRREVGDFTTLANPRIRAKNREKAKVLVGDRVPVITATTGTGGFVSDSVNYIDVGLKLEVEPTVYADDEVAIKVALEVSSIAGQTRTNSGTVAYQIGTRNASTVLRLRDGETQLLAGLISNEDRTAANRVPGLGDLPLAGRLFSTQQDESNRTELVLAITPRILRNVRRPTASESEIWVGTDLSPRIRPVGGRFPTKDPAPVTSGATGQTAPGVPDRPGALAPTPWTPASGPSAVSLPSSPPNAVVGVPVLPGALPPGGGGPLGPGGESPAAPVSAPRVEFRWRAPAEVKVGEEFTATLEIASAVPLRGAPMQIRLNKARVQVVDLTEGEFFKQGGATTTFTKDLEASDEVLRAAILRNFATTAQGEGALVTLRMKALTSGPVDVALVGIKPVTTEGQMPRTILPVVLRALAR